MNSEHLGTRITENGALDQKIWALEAFRGKMVFLEGSREYLWNFRVVEGFWHKRQGLLWSLENFQGFLWIFGVFGEVYDLLVNSFQIRGVLLNFFQVHRNSELIYNKSRSFFAKFVGIIGFWNYFSTVKFVDPPWRGGPATRLGPWWTERAARTITQWHVVSARCAGRCEAPKLTSGGQRGRGRG
jgi:hypothetical protein